MNRNTIQGLERHIPDIVNLLENSSLNDWEVAHELDNFGGSLPLILMHTRALKTYLLGGYLPCRKDYKVWYFSK